MNPTNIDLGCGAFIHHHSANAMQKLIQENYIFYKQWDQVVLLSLWSPAGGLWWIKLAEVLSSALRLVVLLQMVFVEAAELVITKKKLYNVIKKL